MQHPWVRYVAIDVGFKVSDLRFLPTVVLESAGQPVREFGDSARRPSPAQKHYSGMLQVSAPVEKCAGGGLKVQHPFGSLCSY